MSIRLACVVAGLIATAAAAEPRLLEFHRVHVPAGRLGDVPLDGGRYVPMPISDFDAAVARAKAGGGVAPAPPATAARWRVAFDDAGVVVGTVAWDVDPAAAGPGQVLPLTGLVPSRAVHVADPPREAMVCGVADGLGVVTPWPGTYEVEFSCGLPGGGATCRLPLVPALTTSILLDVPAGMRPVLSGPAARRAVVVPPAAAGANGWRIDLGPAAEIGITLEPELPPPGVAVWSDVTFAGPRATLAAVVTPAGPWRPGRIVLQQDPSLRMTEVRVADDDERLDHRSIDDGNAVEIVVPSWLDGRRSPLIVRGVAPATGSVWRLPLVRAPAAMWTGGGFVVRLDPTLAVHDIEATDCQVVPAEATAGWPRPDPLASDADARGAPATYAVEEQGPTAACALELVARTATLDVARVTTVEITPGAVLGRAACDVRVAGGAAFEIESRVAPGWIIDSVDAADRAPDVDGETDRSDAPPSHAAVDDRLLDWRVVPSPAGDRLRISLAIGATVGRGIGLRIAGHRATLAPGAAFTTADLDMVRFDGEAVDGAVIDLRTDADAFVEIAGQPAGWFEVDERLVPLVEEGRARARIRGGDRTADREARLVRRRPPIDVRVDVRLEPYEDRLGQTFTFDCRTPTGIESLVVDFAEPGGEGLNWQVESPAGVGATARPLEPAEGGLASRSDAVVASWLVELSPPPGGPVRLRATRSVPFTQTVPVPLAWVEGAAEPGGTVVVAAAAGPRPRLVNRGLRELPTAADAAAAQAEFAFGAASAGVAADLLPAPRGVTGRAWAWSERVACWCEESGATESVSRFDIENEGRGDVTLALAPGRRLEAVLVDGVAPPGVEFGPAGGTWRIPLPPNERRVEIVVRTATGGRSGRGAWRIDPVGCSLDVPVLDRDVQLMVPPGLVASRTAAEAIEDGRQTWLARLTGLRVGAEAGAGPADGYRRVAVAVVRERGVLIVRRKLVAAAAVLVGVLAGIATFLRTSRRVNPAAFLIAVIPAVAALWVPDAFVPVARAAWWGVLAGLVCGWWCGGARLPRPWPARAAAACVTALALTGGQAAAEDMAFRVFVTPDRGGDIALVPERLFRALAAFAAPESAAVRVLACRIQADVSEEGGAWRVAIDVDADAGGAIAFDAGPGARWLPRPAAAGMRAEITGGAARLTATAAGRYTVELGLAPAVVRDGPVETAAARIPVAPVATLRMAAADVARGVVCERAAAGQPFTRAAVTAESLDAVSFDVAAATEVRLVRSVDPRRRLATGVRAADAVNDIDWSASGCRVEAGFDLDAGPDLVRSVVVRVDPRLEDLAPAAVGATTPRLVPLGGGRVRVEFAEALSGRVRVGLLGRLPLADPVGVFDVPGIWLDGVADETRTIHISSMADLDARLDPPAVAGLTATEFAGRPPPRLIVRRPRQQVRGVQRLDVAFAPGGMDLSLEAQIDAGTGALARIPIDVPVGCVVDRVALLTDDAAPERHEVVDAVWLRTAADRVLVVVQRPRTGRFRLEVQARLPQRPAARGRLPLVRARVGDSVPLLVTWSVAAPLAVTVRGWEQTAASDAVEIADGTAEPEYEMTMAADAEHAAEPAAPAPIADEATGVERAEVRAACDARGRVQGLARFDVVTAETTVRLILPPGLRLFDVLVDGRAIAAEPRAADAWDVPIGVATWPRTILVVFAGDAGRIIADGGPLALPPPRIEGLPMGEVLWSLRPPPGFELRIAPPARPLDAAALAVERTAACGRITAAFGRAVAASVGPERERLEALAALRGRERGPAVEEAWSRESGWAEGIAAPITVAARGPLVIRAVRAADVTMPSRALATIVLVAVGGLAWTVAARGRATPSPS